MLVVLGWACSGSGRGDRPAQGGAGGVTGRGGTRTDATQTGGQGGSASGGANAGGATGGTHAAGGSATTDAAEGSGGTTAASGGSPGGSSGTVHGGAGGADIRDAATGGIAGAGDGGGGRASGTGGRTATGGASDGSGGAACDPGVSDANRAVVTRALDELFVRKDPAAIDRYWADPYYQHNPVAGSGVATFRSFMAPLVTSGSFSYTPLLMLADCELALAYGRYSQTGVIFDMFRVRDGKLMEHWDSDANQASETTGLPARDATAPTGQNRELFRAFAEQVLVAGDLASAGTFLASDYVEHHGQRATGAAAFSAYLTNEKITYTKVHHVIADGNFVFALSEGKRGSTGYGFYDLFRVANGKLAEHWDSRRSVPSSTASGLGIF